MGRESITLTKQKTAENLNTFLKSRRPSRDYLVNKHIMVDTEKQKTAVEKLETFFSKMEKPAEPEKEWHKSKSLVINRRELGTNGIDKDNKTLRYIHIPIFFKQFVNSQDI